jgi:hypothetical protein
VVCQTCLVSPTSKTGEGATTTPAEPAKKPKADAALASAVDDARAILASEVGEDQFGEHLGVVVEDDRVVTHLFEARQPGYRGWQWGVTMTRAPRQKALTVNEIVLLPGAAALQPPPWVPWKERVQKGDLGPGDLVPIEEDDVRLVPGYLVGDEALDQTSARDVREVVREIGLGRERVLSVSGRDQAAERWLAGDNGPDAPIALAAPAKCASCGFMVRLNGPLSTAFGVCANVSSPSDGQVVAFGHGCGAHSDVREQAHPSTATPTVHDTLAWDTWGDTEIDLFK